MRRNNSHGGATPAGATDSHGRDAIIRWESKESSTQLGWPRLARRPYRSRRYPDFSPPLNYSHVLANIRPLMARRKTCIVLGERRGLHRCNCIGRLPLDAPLPKSASCSGCSGHSNLNGTNRQRGWRTSYVEESLEFPALCDN